MPSTDDISGEEALNERVARDRPGTRFVAARAGRWGELLVSADDENPGKTSDGLRLLLIGSAGPGHSALQTVKGLERRRPELLNLIAFATDDASNPHARISVEKRVWHFMDAARRLTLETDIVESALRFGVPVFTGDTKSDAFHAQLVEWSPQLILICGFGQILDDFVIAQPEFGVYNFHPSDLAAKHGAGAAPFADLEARGALTTRWTVHQVSAQIDAGPIVGTSPPIRVRDVSGALPENPLVLLDKMAEALPWLLASFLVELLGNPRRIERLDFCARIPKAAREQWMEPVMRTAPLEFVPEPPEGVFVGL